MTSPTDNSRVYDGGPAFPNTGNTNWDLRPEAGMSLRDWFAGQSLAALDRPSALFAGEHAKMAYAIADAMLAARKGGDQP